MSGNVGISFDDGQKVASTATPLPFTSTQLPAGLGQGTMAQSQRVGVGERPERCAHQGRAADLWRLSVRGPGSIGCDHERDEHQRLGGAGLRHRLGQQ